VLFQSELTCAAGKFGLLLIGMTPPDAETAFQSAAVTLAGCPELATKSENFPVALTVASKGLWLM